MVEEFYTFLKSIGATRETNVKPIIIEYGYDDEYEKWYDDDDDENDRR